MLPFKFILFISLYWLGAAKTPNIFQSYKTIFRVVYHIKRELKKTYTKTKELKPLHLKSPIQVKIQWQRFNYCIGAGYTASY